MNPIEQFQQERAERIAAYGKDAEFQALSLKWIEESMRRMYVYNFDWMGRPIIQYPQDIVGMQELIWKVKPDLIIETGIAHGGSLIFSASMLALLDMCEAIQSGSSFNPAQSKRKVIGIDIDIREHNRAEIEAHPMASRIQMIQGSSIAPETVAQVKKAAEGYKNVLVCLDSMHTDAHVFAELEAYAPMVSVGSYCAVFDTLVEDMPRGFYPDRPWDVGDNPKTAVRRWIKDHPEFVTEQSVDHKLMITVTSEGFLRRIA